MAEESESANPYVDVTLGCLLLSTPILPLPRSDLPAWTRMGNFTFPNTNLGCNGNLDYADEDQSELFVLPTWFEKSDEAGDDAVENWREVYGLIIRPMSESSDNYERAGFLNYYCGRNQEIPSIIKNAPVRNISLY